MNNYRLEIEQKRALNQGGDRLVAEFNFYADTDDQAISFKDQLIDLYDKAPFHAEWRYIRFYVETDNGFIEIRKPE